MERPLLVYTTFPDADAALAVGEALVRLRRAACVNVLPGMRSVYACLTKLPTTAGSRPEPEEPPPSETPIILHLPVAGADPDTMAWIVRETAGAA